MSERFIAERFPFARVTLVIGDDLSLRVNALVDTGFDGFAIVPVGTLDSVRGFDSLSWRLPDGTRVATKTVRGTAQFEGIARVVEVAISELGDEALIGRGLVDQFKVTLDHGRTLTIEP